jgi:hypothetical protein
MKVRDESGHRRAEAVHLRGREMSSVSQGARTVGCPMSPPVSLGMFEVSRGLVVSGNAAPPPLVDPHSAEQLCQLRDDRRIAIECLLELVHFVRGQPQQTIFR